MGYVTKHGKKRLKERVGIGKNEKSVTRLADKALECGIPHSQTKGELRRYIDRHYLTYKKGNNIRVYGDKLYIFDKNVLITVLQIPSKITKNMKQFKKLDKI